MTLEERRKNTRLRKQLETDYKLERDVISPYRRHNGILRGLVDAICIAVKNHDMSESTARAELIILGISPEDTDRLLGSDNDL